MLASLPFQITGKVKLSWYKYVCCHMMLWWPKRYTLYQTMKGNLLGIIMSVGSISFLLQKVSFFSKEFAVSPLQIISTMQTTVEPYITLRFSFLLLYLVLFPEHSCLMKLEIKCKFSV